MKKILFIFAMMLAFGVSAQAQEKKASAASKGRQEAVELADFLKLNSTELENFSKLFQMKHEMLADPSVTAQKKKEVPVIMEKKIEGSLDGNQVEKLRANKVLWEKLTH
ncbi:hypothetical protein [Flavobacterium selenitireducens]|uniref:hypothetical protein n=1 Tax=Flavobacterium selenitireducens TaxID=2722704 RepID=UPI00168BBA73|nr:hypothetical protein [Flavobacterium selenitireducens]MBD3583385.1 hypothetical protein [Flavobacterium selenitireducens]